MPSLEGVGRMDSPDLSECSANRVTLFVLLCRLLSPLPRPSGPQPPFVCTVGSGQACWWLPLSGAPPSELCSSWSCSEYRRASRGEGQPLCGVPQRPPYMAPQVSLFAWIQGGFPKTGGPDTGVDHPMSHSIPPGIPERAQREPHFLLPPWPGLGFILLHVYQLSSGPGPVSL